MSQENNQNGLIRHNDQLQMMPIGEVQQWYNSFVEFSKSIMKVDLDYGVIPGCAKPSLYKPGAEKLRFVYGLGSEFTCIDKTVDLDKPFVDYTYKCVIKSKTGQILAECEGNCNSMEAKFGFLWLRIDELPEGTDISKLRSKTTGKKISEFDFAINKGETTGQYGKPQEYWNKWVDAINSGKAKKILKKAKSGREMDAYEIDEEVTLYRVLNPDVVGMKNTIMKMAQKRAFVGAVLMATGASEFYTQDIEDMEINGVIHSVDSPEKVATETATETKADGKKENAGFEEAVIVSETKNNSTPAAAQQTIPGTEKATSTAPAADDDQRAIPGHWYAKLERCKTEKDVDELALKHKETVQGWPKLYKLFKETKDELHREAKKNKNSKPINA